MMDQNTNYTYIHKFTPSFHRGRNYRTNSVDRSVPQIKDFENQNRLSKILSFMLQKCKYFKAGYLFGQRIGIAIQRGNAVSLLGTFPDDMMIIYFLFVYILL